MATLDEKFSALATEVVATIDILAEWSAEPPHDIDSAATNPTAVIERYTSQLSCIAAMAKNLGLIGLYRACITLREGIDDLRLSALPTKANQQFQLEEWPALIINYLESPDDAASWEPMVEFLDTTDWIASFSQEDAHNLRCLFTGLQAHTEVASYHSHENKETTKHLPIEFLERASQQNADTLQCETAELVDLLIEQSAGDTMESDQLLTTYAKHLNRFATTAGISGFLGLQEACVLLQEELETLMQRDHSLSESEYLWLETWPLVVIEYLESPTNPGAIEKLIDCVQSASSITPLSEEQAFALKEVFMLPQPTKPSEQASTSYQAEDSLDPDIDSSEETRETDGSDRSQESLHEEAQLNLNAESALATETPWNADPETPEAQPDSHAPEGLSAQAQPPSLDETTQELITVIRYEVEQLGESLQNCLQTVIDEKTTREIRDQVLADHLEELTRLVDASESVGFVGLHRSSVHFKSNLEIFRKRGQPLNAVEHALLSQWPLLLLTYLDETFSVTICNALVESLCDAHWPDPISQEQVSELVTLLATPKLDLGEEETQQRQRHAQLQDISLELPNDVNAELLDSLLQELPTQTAYFSSSIQQLTDGMGTFENLDSAQRIAHTLKGAANTVGVNGIANLTHHIEDILVVCTKHHTVPSALHGVLINAADCLENMSEALLGISEPPPEAETLATLQTILDWANQIDHAGLPSEGDQFEPRQTLPDLGKQSPESMPKPPNAQEPIKATEPAETSQQKSPIHETLRVPATLVDDLLRLVGETMILNGQLQDRLRNIFARFKATHRQNLLMQQLALELEQIVDIQGITSPLIQGSEEEAFDPLEMDQYNELHTISRRFVEATTDAREINQDAQKGLTGLSNLLVNQERLHKETEAAVIRTRMIPVQTIVPRLHRSIRQACRLTDKQAELHVTGQDTLMDSNVLNELIDPLMHILRNAVDHGIERQEERAVMGKEHKGQITLAFAREGNNLTVRCQDDGAGLDLAYIRYTAQERGLIDPNQQTSDEELSRLILLPGFSTRSATTQVSGRGIGMDAVYSRVMAMKGSLNVHSQEHEGCTVELKLPVTLISTHGLLVKSGEQMFAIADRGIEQILYPGIGQVGNLGSRLTYQIKEDIHETTTLETLLNLPSELDLANLGHRPALLIQDESGVSHVVLVDAVLDSRDLVVKSMGRYVPKIKGTMGATILGDGTVTPVLDMPELLHSSVKHQVNLPVSREATENAVKARTPLALIVDDSLSARRSLAQFVQDMGYEARTARDGLEAISVLKEIHPEILLIDLEMPRMNGMELTSHVRNTDEYAAVPIIMITSRTTEKHRHQAMAAGVNTYLNKPFSEDELAQQIHQLTALKGAA